MGNDKRYASILLKSNKASFVLMAKTLSTELNTALDTRDTAIREYIDEHS